MALPRDTPRRAAHRPRSPLATQPHALALTPSPFPALFRPCADPWEHVGFAFVGAWAASKLVSWEEEQKAELRRTLQRQGRPTTVLDRE